MDKSLMGKNDYRVWELGDEESFKDIRAMSGSHAAEVWAGIYDSSGDYRILNGDCPIVVVEDYMGRASHWKVRGEMDADYYADPEIDY